MSLEDSQPAGSSVAESLAIIRGEALGAQEGDYLVAAFTLLKHCVSDSRITLGDALRCLDHAGVIAEVGARILYIRTGRDGLARQHPQPGQFVTNKNDWIDYLANNGDEFHD